MYKVGDRVYVSGMWNEFGVIEGIAMGFEKVRFVDTDFKQAFDIDSQHVTPVSCSDAAWETICRARRHGDGHGRY